MQNLLIESGIPEEITAKIEKSYVETFGDDLPLVENLIDAKVLKANEQIKKEKQLEKQVEILQTRLEQVKKEVAVDNENPAATEDHDNLESTTDNMILDEEPEYDVILQVKPEKIPQIKSQIIDGQKCIVIPIDEDEQTTVNGINNLI
ncbi:hypothetical protein SDC9_134624 [bioreactor metagenome]|uniref:Uncharacterized protein n=1 Tax=bioreactor metagenome TaxID=1076179 RepID=A0A645DE41_9ZZZZ